LFPSALMSPISALMSIRNALLRLLSAGKNGKNVPPLDLVCHSKYIYSLMSGSESYSTFKDFSVQFKFKTGINERACKDWAKQTVRGQYLHGLNHLSQCLFEPKTAKQYEGVVMEVHRRKAASRGFWRLWTRFPVFPVFPCAFETHKRVPESNELLVFGAYEHVFPVFPVFPCAFGTHKRVPESN